MFIGQAWHKDGDIPIDIQQSIIKMQQYCDDMNIEYRFRRFAGGLTVKDCVVASDTFRNYWAIEDPQLLWADCDVEFNDKIPNFIGTKPYFAEVDNGGWCNGIFYANGNSHFFDQLQRLGERRKITNRYFWTSAIMNIRGPIVEPFPKIYSHPFLTTRKKEK